MVPMLELAIDGSWLPVRASDICSRLVIRRRWSGANATRAPLAVPARKQSSGVTAKAVMAPCPPSYRITTCNHTHPQ